MDNVNNPKHYNMGKYEAIDVIEDWKLNFNLGNALKYISRAEWKGKKVEDLRKAIWYLNREIQNTESREIKLELKELFEMQKELDEYILEKHDLKMSKEELLDNTILALLVEVGELANTTRCFKHWSTKGMMEKEIILDELADCLHFYLSIGNQIGEEYLDIGMESGFKGLDINSLLTFELLVLYSHLGEFGNECSMSGVDLEEIYQSIGDSIFKIIDLLDFTDEEVEQAYLKKHKKNYERQENGY